jgi:hypothetical protein
LEGEGFADQVAGTVKETAVEAAQVAGQTIHDLNR